MKKSSSKSNDSSGKPGPSAREILDQACGRNIPICVVRPRQAGRVPMARGRMLSIGKEGIDIDQVQVPGLELRFAKDDDLQAYFSMGQTLYQFKTRLTKLCEPKRLNARMLIPGMTVTEPGSLSQGDRRNIFRVSVAAQADRPSVSVWRLVQGPPAGFDSEESPDAMPAMPSTAFNLHGMELGAVASKLLKKPEHEGWVVDATESGLGIRLESITAGRFDIFEPILIRVVMPAEAFATADDGSDLHQLDFVAEVRSKRDVGDDGCRLGVSLLDENDVQLMRQKRNVLRKYLAEIQREHLRKSRGRAA